MKKKSPKQIKLIENNKHNLKRIIKNAILEYITRIIRCKKDKIIINSSIMIINISTFTKNHKLYKKICEKILSKIIINAGKIVELDTLLYNYYDNFDKKFIEDQRVVIASDLFDNIFILNKENKNQNNILSLSKNIIIIGGNLLGRGLTFNNLLVTIMLNESEATRESTLLQRARWFGDRSIILNYMLIYLTERTHLRYFIINKTNTFAKKIINNNDNEFNTEIQKKIDDFYAKLLFNFNIKLKGREKIE